MYETGIHYCSTLKYKFIWRKDQNIWLYNSLLKLRMVIWSDNNHSVESCSVLNLNYPFWHETCKLSNNNGLNFSNVKHDKILLSVWPLTCIYIQIELCMMLFYFICHRKYCFILYSFTYMYTYLLNQVPGWHPRARPWAHLKLLLQYKTLSLWVLGGWTSHLGLFNIC